jgi:hypothetical protein
MASFALAGHLSLGLIASLGAFTALYGTTMPLRVRLRALAFVAAGFVVASVLGELCADNASLSSAATAAKGDSALATTARVGTVTWCCSLLFQAASQPARDARTDSVLQENAKHGASGGWLTRMESPRRICLLATRFDSGRTSRPSIARLSGLAP